VQRVDYASNCKKGGIFLRVHSDLVEFPFAMCPCVPWRNRSRPVDSTYCSRPHFGIALRRTSCTPAIVRVRAVAEIVAPPPSIKSHKARDQEDNRTENPP
jgi:hypothetical protein